MTRSRDWLAATMLATGFLAGCSDPVAGGNGNGTTDAGGGNDVVVTGDTGTTDMDAGMSDAGRTDVPRTDARTDGATTDRGPARDTGPMVTNACAMGAIVDLTTRMPGMDGTVTYSGDTLSAPEMTGLTPPSGCVPNMAPAGYQRVHRYRMRSTAILTVSTDSKSTDFDTVVLMSTACGMGMNLGCNDDIAQGNTNSTARSASPIAMGTEVFIAVGGYDTEQGSYELSIRETTPIAIGAQCRAGDVCAPGSVCIAAGAGSSFGTCTATGTQGSQCRAGGDAGAACDAGLECTGTTMTNPGTCVRRLAVGDECGTVVGAACPTGSACAASPSMTNPLRAVCLAEGAAGGACRMADPRCDGALQCSSTTTCRAAAMTGAACDITGRSTFCPAGNSCAANVTLTGGTCAADGTVAGAACRAASDGGMRCDAGLTCSTTTGAGVCRREVAMGMPCERLTGSTVCAMGTVCVPGTNPNLGTCAAATAEMEPNNTATTGNAPATASIVYSAALMPMTDIDCFRVTVPMGASLRVSTGDAAGTCNLGMGADTILTVSDSMGRLLGENDDAIGLCSQLDGRTTPSLRNMAAGTYSICVTGYQQRVAIMSYYVYVAVTPGT